ncbi:uncharacterized protein C2845_PM02G38870 [Panicum miliaceum]|uniref:At1g61320/AtMIF1 LRR domain-containing protein n=1 Tax=Panicum miliaceum TaxID=4540 RepID=A0A3L6SAH1_PANMI|nr:uncharacterized protein C2845_PM02G38870 [Panicum miliaceum]
MASSGKPGDGEGWQDEQSAERYRASRLQLLRRNQETHPLSDAARVVNTPMLPTKFLCLKHLTICLPGSFPWSYDYFSLVSFLDASPSLETLSLDIPNKAMEDESIFRHSSDLRQMAEDQHRIFRECIPVGNSLRVKRRALVAIRKFIEDKVPAGVKLTVVEPCSRCH